MLKSKIIPYPCGASAMSFCIPMLYVTHDWDEVKALCSEALILERGEIVRRELITQIDTP